MNSPILACHGLSKIYNDGTNKIEVLKDIDLFVDAGEMLAIVGNSGSGKSTLLHLLGGLDKPSAGQVILHGKNIHALAEVERCKLRNQYLGFVYQFHHLLPEFTALENVSMPLMIGGIEKETRLAQAQEVLTQVGLGARLGHRIGQLSGGERQRVAIARALVMKPLCVLADEPTGNLDPRNAERILELFFSLQAQRRTSVIMVTHDMDIAKRAKRIMRIVDGKLEIVE
jgi:lipoprotein-releasing system ATP-binding protein